MSNYKEVIQVFEDFLTIGFIAYRAHTITKFLRINMISETNNSDSEEIIQFEFVILVINVKIY